jgi:hypothetical protein
MANRKPALFEVQSYIDSELAEFKGGNPSDLPGESI